MPDDQKHSAKPFLKWAGGKQWLASKIARVVPDQFGTYYEPFLGSGALYFELQPRRAVLSDLNSRLMQAYVALRDDCEAVVGYLSQWANSSEVYYRIRGAEFSEPHAKAAQFIYLNKTGWNGLYRTNRDGKFNVPFANNKRPIYREADLRRAATALARAKLISGDFEEALAGASKGDLAYLDPPYTVLHSENGFRRYNEKIFSWDDQLRLARRAQELRNSGCFVIISNAYAPEVMELFAGFTTVEIARASTIASNPRARRQTSEALLFSFDAHLEGLIKQEGAP